MFGGIVAAGSLETAEAGAEILRAGGNATDAAVGAALAAFHVEPLLASAAGGGLMLAGDPDRGFHTLDFVPTTPGLGRPRPQALDFRPVSIDFGVAQQIFHVGRGAAAVPTGLAGLYEAHRRWGRLPLAVVVEPAVRRCREGVHLNDTAASFIQLLKPIWSLTPESAELYTVRGRVAVAGDVVVNPNFADVLELMAREGMRPFQEGEVATRIVDAFGPEQGGLITGKTSRRIRPSSVPRF